jgi:uncharacterized protein YkwD
MGATNTTPAMTLTKRVRRQPTAAQRRLQGIHHKRSDHYLKAYWPYLPVFAVLGLGLVANLFIHRSDHNVLGYATNVSNQVLLVNTNEARSKHNAPALQLDTELSKAAQAKADDMARRNYWSHITPDGQQPWKFIDNTHYSYDAAGENLAYGFGSSDQVVTAWMNSLEHRENVLNASYHDVGFGMANVANFQGHGPETIVVAFYAEPANLNMVWHANSKFENLSSSQTVSRLQVITTATWAQLCLAALCGVALTLFFVRHIRAWHKVLVKSEVFIVKHPFFDVFLLGAAVFVFLLSHIAGTIL